MRAEVIFVTAVVLCAVVWSSYVYSKDTDGSPGNQGTVDTAQIAWDFLSKF